MGVSLRRTGAGGQPGVGGGSEGGEGSATEQLLDLLQVGLRHRHQAGQVAGLLARLHLEPVAQSGLLAQDLALAGHPDPLRDPAVRLVLGHGCSVRRDAPGSPGASSGPAGRGPAVDQVWASATGTSTTSTTSGASAAGVGWAAWTF